MDAATFGGDGRVFSFDDNTLEDGLDSAIPRSSERQSSYRRIRNSHLQLSLKMHQDALGVVQVAAATV